MANTITIKLRNDVGDNWSGVNPVLAKGELGYDSTANRAKIGDGVTSWNSLKYLDPQIVNDLTTGGANAVLSAEQGKLLNSLLGTKTDIGHNHSLTDAQWNMYRSLAPSAADKGKVVGITVDALGNVVLVPVDNIGDSGIDPASGNLNIVKFALEADAKEPPTLAPVTGSWEVPDGVNTIWCTVIAPGGSGGNPKVPGALGGGAGGYVYRQKVSVKPGEWLYYMAISTYLGSDATSECWLKGDQFKINVTGGRNGTNSDWGDSLNGTGGIPNGASTTTVTGARNPVMQLSNGMTTEGYGYGGNAEEYTADHYALSYCGGHGAVFIEYAKV